jgi:hypothetical protein
VDIKNAGLSAADGSRINCMLFGSNSETQVPMQSKSSTSTVLIVLLLVFTFPIWIGIAGGLFGIIAGIFGAAIGIFAGIFGAIFGLIGGLFGWAFDWHPFAGWFNTPVFVIAALVIVVLLVTKSKK